MGCGKSTYGRLLAKESKRFFLDTDTLIEEAENKSVKEIFASEGEKHFRALECACASWLCQSVQEAVISTGGGLPVFYDNLRQLGTVIYLKKNFETLVEDLSEEDFQKRPLFKELESARELHKNRNEIYTSLADHIVAAPRNLEEADKLTQEILDFLPKKP